MMLLSPRRYGVRQGVNPFASALYLDNTNWLQSPSDSLISGTALTIDVRCRIADVAVLNWCLFGQGETGAASDQEFAIDKATRTLYYLKQVNVGDGTPNFQCQSSATVPVDEWALVSMELTGTHIYLYIDGDVVASSAYTNYWWNTGYPLYIGHETVVGYPSSDRFYKGYMDEIRVTNVARYGGVSFTPQTTRFDNTDPYWANVITLMHFDTDFTCEKGVVWTPVNSPVVQNAPDNWES